MGWEDDMRVFFAALSRTELQLRHLCLKRHLRSINPRCTEDLAVEINVKQLMQCLFGDVSEPDIMSRNLHLFPFVGRLLYPA